MIRVDMNLPFLPIEKKHSEQSNFRWVLPEKKLQKRYSRLPILLRHILA
jgi:hypothetical protein